MSDPNPLGLAPDAPVAEGEEKGSQGGNKLLGVTLKGWAVTCISALAVLSATGTVAFTLYGKWQDTKRTSEGQSGQLASLNSQVAVVSKITGQKSSEAQKHAQSNDRYVAVPIMNGQGGEEKIVAEYYPSDGCLHITRTPSADPSPGGKQAGRAKANYGITSQEEWIVDPNPSPTQRAQVDSGNSRSRNPTPQTGLSLNAITVNWPDEKSVRAGLRYALERSKPRLKRAGMYQGSCLNPHPGQFQFRNQQVDACTIQTWRTFADGCTHYQFYNACNGQWAPNVVWTVCQMQHRW